MDQDVVRKAPLFAALDDEAASTLMSSMAKRRLERGDVLFHEGDQGDRLYVIGEIDQLGVRIGKRIRRLLRRSLHLRQDRYGSPCIRSP